MNPIWFWALLSFALLMVTELMRSSCRRWWRRRRALRRSERAARGELTAESILRDAGYHVLERQPRCELKIMVDGHPFIVDLRADLLVEKKGRTMVAEVKTGKSAPRIDNKATRRQLLEYRIAYEDAEGVLLVDAESRKISEVTFPLPPSRSGFSLSWVLIGMILGALAFALLSRTTISQ